MKNVKVGVIICEAKNYFRPYLLPVLRSLQGVSGFVFVYDDCDEWEELRSLPDSVVADRHVNPINEASDGAKMPPWRISHYRQIMRSQFLAGAGDYLLNLDCDTIPPADAIPRLIARNAALSSAFSCQRGDREVVSLPSYKDPSPGRTPPSPDGLLGYEEADDGNYWAGHFGMGCLLMRRDVLEATPWRDPDYLYSVDGCEDVQFCADANKNGFGKVYLDLSISCWHADKDGFSNHIIVGAKDFVVQWTGQPFYVYNKFGSFARNSPVWDLPEEVRNVLPEEFSRGFYPRLTLEVKRTEELGICPL